MEAQAGASAQITAVDPQTLRVEIAGGDNQAPESLGLVREDFALRGAENYVLGFRARADQPRSIVVSWQTPVGENGAQGRRQCELATDWEWFYFAFSNHDPQAAGSIRMELGGPAGSVELAEVSLVRRARQGGELAVASAQESPPADLPTRTPEPPTTPAPLALAGPEPPAGPLGDRVELTSSLGAEAQLLPGSRGPASLRVEIGRAVSGRPRAVQLTVGGVLLEADCPFQATVVLQADPARKVHCCLMDPSAGQGPAAWEQVLDIGPTPQTIQFPVCLAATSSGQASWRMELGDQTGSVEIQQLRFEAAAPLGPSAAVAAHRASPGGGGTSSGTASSGGASSGGVVPVSLTEIEVAGPASYVPPVGAPPYSLLELVLREGALATVGEGATGPNSQRLVIQNAGSAHPWAVQLKRAGLAVQPGETVRVFLRARSERPRSIGCVLAQDHAPWQGLAKYQTLELNVAWQDYFLEFPIQNGDAAAMLYLDAGADGAWVEVADVDIQTAQTTAVGAAPSAEISPAAQPDAAPGSGQTSANPERGAEPMTFPNDATSATAIAGELELIIRDEAQATAEPAGADGRRVTIASRGQGNPWSVQLMRGGLAVESGKTYVLTFRARADQPRSAVCSVAQNHEPWQGLGLWAEMQLTTAWQEFRHEFTAQSTESSARAYLDLGASDVAVEVEGLRLQSP